MYFTFVMLRFFCCSCSAFQTELPPNGPSIPGLLLRLKSIIAYDNHSIPVVDSSLIPDSPVSKRSYSGPSTITSSDMYQLSWIRHSMPRLERYFVVRVRSTKYSTRCMAVFPTRLVWCRAEATVSCEQWQLHNVVPSYHLPLVQNRVD